jgi:hypothetical protein
MAVALRAHLGLSTFSFYSRLLLSITINETPTLPDGSWPRRRTRRAKNLALNRALLGDALAGPSWSACCS